MSEYLGRGKVELVISPGALSPSLRQRLISAGIAAIEHAGFEETKSVSQALQVIPWLTTDNDLGQANIGQAVLVQSTVLGGQHSVRIVTTSSTTLAPTFTSWLGLVVMSVIPSTTS